MSMIELDDWILAVNVEEHEKMVGSIERVMWTVELRFQSVRSDMRLRSR